MRGVSDKSKVLYLFILIIFLSGIGFFWLDYIGLVNITKTVTEMSGEADSVVNASDDEPSLIAREEFEKEKEKLSERIEQLDKRDALLTESEKTFADEKAKLDEVRKGLDLEKKKLEDEKAKYSGYKKNVRVLADKISNMPPGESVKIMEKWEEPLIIDVLRQMDSDAEEAGRASITSFLMTLFPKEKASRIMYLMTQL